MARDRWEWFEGVRATSLEDAVAHEAARVLADELLDWPPPIEWEDARAAAEFASIFTTEARRPSLAALSLGFRLGRWELERAFETIDYAVRNDVFTRELDDAKDRLAARFVWRWLPEWLLGLKERAGPRITRAHLVATLDQAEARVRGRLAQA